MWTYVHRVLHVLGVAAIDKEEVALLSGPLVRIRAVRPRRRSVVLAHYPDHLYPDEPVGWVDPAEVPFHQTLFFLHIDTSDPQRPDRARIATAAPSDTTPRAWLALDPKTGVISLTVSELSAAVFNVRVSPTRRHGAEVTLQCTCTAGSYLSVHEDTMRARVNANSVTPSERFLINNVPLPPTLSPSSDDQPPHDCTMAVAYNATRSSPLRIQSRAFGWFLSSKPGAPLASSSSKDAGWDGFTLEYDSPTRSALLRDSRGLYLGFNSEMDKFVAATDPGNELDTATNEHRCTGGGHERFAVETVGEDDRVVLRSRKGYLSARRGGSIVISQDTEPGRREQFYLRQALPSMMDQSTPRLRIRTVPGGARQVEASVLVPAPVSIAYDVIRDYAGFSQFLTDASESRIVQRRSPTELTVLMVQCHTFLVLTIPMTLVLDVIENHDRRILLMNLKSGLGVKEYKGRWEAIERPDGRCLIRCTILAASSVPAPGFLLDGLMSHATQKTMEELRTEAIRRSTVEETKTVKGKQSAVTSSPKGLLHKASMGFQV